MRFPKDILVLDFEGTRTDPTQIGAVLLNKNTLEEKGSFVSYIYANLNGRRPIKSGITQEMLEGAPSQAEAGKQFHEKFGTDIFIATWVANWDMFALKKILAAGGIDFDTTYDYHVFDIWPAAYLYALKNGYAGGVQSEEMFQWFGAKARGLHNALEDARIAADVLRKIVAQ